MRTTDQWLALPDDKLALELGRVFMPGDWVHDWPEYQRYGSMHCRKCNKTYNEQAAFSPCLVPDPIKLDWNTAMEWFRQHSPSRTILRQVCGPEPIDCVSWFLVTAQSKHFLIATAMAYERNKE